MDNDVAAARRATARRVILGLLALALVTRLPYFNLPVQGDEARTYTFYCAQTTHPVLIAATRYPGPHNHLLHSVLFTWLYTTAGSSFPWLRLPALLAGVACVPLSYVVLRRMIGRNAAVIAAVLVAYSGWAVRYATNARGYSLSMMLGLIAVGLVWRGRRRGSPIHVAAAGIVSGAAVATVPTLIHLAGGIATWLLVSALMSRTRRKALAGFAVLFSGSAAVTAAVLYLPILSFMGWDALWRHSSVQALSYGAVLSELPRALLAHARMLSNGPLPASIFLVLVVLGAVHLRRRDSFLLFATILTVPIALTVLLRRIPPERTMTFLLPYAAALAAVGGLFVIAQILRFLAVAHQRTTVPRRAMLLSLLALSASAAYTYAARWPISLPGVDDTPDVEPVTRFLAGKAHEDDFVFARTGVSEPIQYHLAHLGRRFDRVDSLPPRTVVAQGVIVRRRNAGLGSKLPRTLKDYRIDRLLFEDHAYQAWRFVRSDLQPLAQNADADEEGL